MGQKNNLVSFGTIYHIACLCVALSLIMWCIYEYSLDNDVTEIQTRNYHDSPDDIYPSLTVCYKNPYKQDRAWKYNKSAFLGSLGNLMSTYKNWIDGNKRIFESLVKKLERAEVLTYNQNKTKEVIQILRDVDYDKVTINVEDFISNYQIEITIDDDNIDYLMYDVVNTSLILNYNRSVITNNVDGLKNVNTYISARTRFLKCFTFDVPYQKELEIRKVEMRLNASIFPLELDLSQMYFTLAYPGQFFRTSLGNRIFADYGKGTPTCYKLQILVRSIEVHKRRDKKSRKCDDDWKNHDQNRLHAIFDSIGCIPQQWKGISKADAPNCSSVLEYQKFNKALNKKKGYIPPCRSIERLSKTTKEKDLSLLTTCIGNSFLDLEVYFDQESLYKEIILTRAYCFQSLIGNAGLYRISLMVFGIM